uniref:Secreted protein n=1 Tax=Ixodes ricinus TaxID=34613 RepID=A0A6B0V0I2_IXORI
MQNCSNVWQHSQRCHLCCIKIPLLFVNFVALSVRIEAYCIPSSILTHTCGLRVSIVLCSSCVCMCSSPRWLLQPTWRTYTSALNLALSAENGTGAWFSKALSLLKCLCERRILYVFAPWPLPAPKPTGEMEHVLRRPTKRRCAFRIWSIGQPSAVLATARNAQNWVVAVLNWSYFFAIVISEQQTPIL